LKNKTFILGILLLGTTFLWAQELRLMTYNIKYDNTNDTVNNWNDRKETMVRLIKFHDPHILGTQEALHRQTVYLDSSLTDYSYVGVGRDDGKIKGEYTAIHYNKTKLKLIRSNTFWLSDTPDVVSIGWDASMERICTYALFESRTTHTKFYVFNTHFDHRGVKARERSVQLILEQIKKVNKEHLPLVLMGDLNLTPEQQPIKELQSKLMDGMKAAQSPFYGPIGTFNGFDQNRVLTNRIDYMFVSGLIVKAYQHIDDRMQNNKHISDHLPVLMTIKF